MASVGKLSFQRLRNEGELDRKILEREVKKAWEWLKFMVLAGIRRPRLRIRIHGLRRFLGRRTKFLSRLRVSWRKALKKMKNGQGHLNDLFGGNFLFMHGNPTPFGCRDKPNMGHGLRRLSTTYSVGRIA